ncbi:MAG: hypothetical protein AAF529_04650 [Pseudomonadota bacterium]
MSGSKAIVPNSRAHRWNVAGRGLLAFFGGFVWVSVFGAVLVEMMAGVTGMSLQQGIHIMTLFSFVGWCGVAMWVFYEPSLRRASTLLLGSAVLLFVLLYLLKLL